MRQGRIPIILLFCFCLLISCSSIFAQQPPQTDEKERGIELYRKGNFSEAVKALKEALKKQGSDSDAWYYLGLSLHRAGKIKDARKAFETTVSLRPDFAHGYAAMAHMHLLNNDNKEAVKNAEKALALDPKNIGALYIAGVVRLRENMATEALVKAEEALKIKPDYPEAMLLKSQALTDMFAQERAKRIVGETGESSGHTDDEGKRHDERSLIKAALESLEAYLKLSPEQAKQSLWEKQLVILRAYAGRESDSVMDKPILPMTSTLKPTILYKERAQYTDAARKARVHGTVVLSIVFADDGVIKNIMVVRSLSHGLIEQAILAALKIRFTPAMQGGKLVSVRGSIEFNFL